MSFFTELKRRNLLRVGVAYAVVAWLLLQVSATLAPALLLPGWFHSGVAFLLILGFPVALFLAWAYELAPDDPNNVEDREITTRAAVRKLDVATIGLLVIALGYFAYDRLALHRAEVSTNVVVDENSFAESREAGTSIAVLPFVNMSDDASNEYFSDGLSEELLNLLAKIPELRVTARTSSFSFRDQVLEIPVIGERLNVAHVLEGSVRKSGNKVRITAQLIDARTDTHLWSDTYDRTLEDIFAVQDEIATDVVGQLKLRLLGPIPTSRTTDPEAFRLFLQGMHLTAQLDFSKNQQAESLFRQALEIDPAYVPAWRELARVLSRNIGPGSSVLDDIRLVRSTLDTALQLDPEDPASLAYRAYQDMRYEGKFQQAALLFERAIAIEPTNENVLRAAAIFAIGFARPSDAIALARYAVDNNPLCFACRVQLVEANISAGEFDAAEEVARTTQSLFDDGLTRLGSVMLLKGQPTLALELFENEKRESSRLYWTALALYDLGQLSRSAEALANFRELADDRLLWDVAKAYAYTNQMDMAFEIIDLAENRTQIIVDGAPIRWDYLGVAMAARDPFFRKLHSDPRWQNTLEQAGISDQQLANLKFEPEILTSDQ